MGSWCIVVVSILLPQPVVQPSVQLVAYMTSIHVLAWRVDGLYNCFCTCYC